MRLCASCMRCLMDRQEERVRDKGREEDRDTFMRQVARIIAESAPEDSAPVLVDRINGEYRKIFGPVTDYDAIKKEFNELMLSLEPDIRSVMEKGEDALHTAFVFARAANYIDFGMAGRVEKETLLELLEQAAEDSMDETVYDDMLSDLEKARKLVYVTDNCGEVVCDKLAVEELKKRYPLLELTVLVRGEPALNDATREDAVQTGLDKAARIVDNGCGVAGTPLDYVGEEAKCLLEEADVILAKGQGNFETMHGCGLNVYYSFLCKCDWFQKRFGMEKNKGMFVRERSS
nr:ARMT1-like domain-containing protein [uncultured Eisenbergiella sp.]